MADKRYQLRILPLFESDLNEIADYISRKLRNPIAAEHLVDAAEAAIYERLPMAEAFEPYRCTRQHRYPYYYIPVGNYLVFYVVIGGVMEVRRMIYSRSDIDRHL